MPDFAEFYPEGEYGDASFYSYADYTEYGEGYSFYYEFNYSVTPKAGTEVTSILVDAGNWHIGSDVKTKASQVMSGEFNTPFTTSVPADALYTGFNNQHLEPAPEVYLMVVWSDADGNYYYKEYALQAELQKYADKMLEMIGLGGESLPTPDGKQWSFNWTVMTGGEDCPAVLDFGVTLDGQCIVAYDPAIMGAPEGTPYQIFNMVSYSFEPADETSGKLIITAVDHYGDEISQEFEYSDLTDNSCYFAFDETSFIGQDADALLTEVEVDVTGGGMIM